MYKKGTVDIFARVKCAQRDIFARRNLYTIRVGRLCSSLYCISKSIVFTCYLLFIMKLNNLK